MFTWLRKLAFSYIANNTIIMPVDPIFLDSSGGIDDTKVSILWKRIADDPTHNNTYLLKKYQFNLFVYPKKDQTELDSYYRVLKQNTDGTFTCSEIANSKVISESVIKTFEDINTAYKLHIAMFPPGAGTGFMGYNAIGNGRVYFSDGILDWFITRYIWYRLFRPFGLVWLVDKFRLWRMGRRFKNHVHQKQKDDEKMRSKIIGGTPSTPATSDPKAKNIDVRVNFWAIGIPTWILALVAIVSYVRPNEHTAQPIANNYYQCPLNWTCIPSPSLTPPKKHHSSHGLPSQKLYKHSHAHNQAKE